MYFILVSIFLLQDINVQIELNKNRDFLFLSREVHETPGAVIDFVEARIPTWEVECPQLFSEMIIAASNALQRAQMHTDSLFVLEYVLVNRRWIIDTLESPRVKLEPADRIRLIRRFQTIPNNNPWYEAQRLEDVRYWRDAWNLFCQQIQDILDDEAKNPYVLFHTPPEYHGQNLNLLDAGLRKKVEDAKAEETRVWNLSAKRQNLKIDYAATRHTLMNDLINMYTRGPVNIAELEEILSTVALEEHEKATVLHDTKEILYNAGILKRP